MPVTAGFHREYNVYINVFFFPPSRKRCKNASLRITDGRGGFTPEISQPLKMCFAFKGF